MISTIIRTFIIYCAVGVCVRLMGKRQLGELQPGELIITILVSEIAATPITDNTLPIINGILPLLLLASFEIISSVIARKSVKFRYITEGTPVTVIKDGILQQQALKTLRYTIDDLLAALRQKDIFDISQVQYAIVETNGQLSVLLKADYDTVTREDMNLSPSPQGYQCPVIIDGKIVEKDFKICNTNNKKIETIISKEKLQIKDILLMTVDSAGNHTIIRKDSQ